MRCTSTVLSLFASSLSAAVIVSCADEPAPPDPSRAQIGGYVTPPSASPSPAVTAPPVVVPPTPPPAPPRALTGGTLLALARAPGNRVMVGDADERRLWVVDLNAQSVVRSVALGADEQPRRMVELTDGRVAVALTRDALLIVEPEGEAEPVRVPVCALPRGVAHDERGRRLLVACREGVLVELSLDTLSVERSVMLPRDLRDVVVAGERVYVTRFKAAEVLLLDRDLALERVVTLAAPPGELTLAPGVAWRAVASPAGALVVVHQQSRVLVGIEEEAEQQGGAGGQEPPPPPPLCYSGPPPTAGSGGPACARAVVTPAISIVEPDGRVRSGPVLARGTLMVDVALRGTDVLLADAGAAPRGDAKPVRHFRLAELGLEEGEPALPPATSCQGVADEVRRTGTNLATGLGGVREGLVTSVAFDRHGRAVALVSAPPVVVHGGIRIPLGGEARDTVGFRLFHQDAAVGVACASCHPEGEDDGHVWNLPQPRRTPALGGGLLDSAPFHWAGDLPTLEALYTEVFEGRMGGDTLTHGQASALTRWLEALPPIEVPAPVDAAAVDRGARLAARPGLGCVTCHMGGAVRRASVDVGTGERLQIPALRGVMFRAPYLHDGCATTLEDRFGRCATAGHGQTGSLTAREVADLVAFLESF